MEPHIKHTHGGARIGSGRKPREASTVVRMPVSLVPVLKTLLAERSLLAGVRHPHPHSSAFKLPLFGHKVHAGFPSPADDYVEAWLDLNEHLIEHRDATFFVQATGNSMIGAGIQEGSLLVVDRSLEAQHGDIIIAVVDGELTVKRLEKRHGRIRLVAENPAFEPIELKEGQELTVWGVVTSVIQRIRR